MTDFSAQVYASVANIQGMLREASITPSGGGAAYIAKVGFNEATEMILGGDVIASVPTIKYATSMYPLKKGDAVTLGAVNYVVDNTERLFDGLESLASLGKA